MVAHGVAVCFKATSDLYVQWTSQKGMQVSVEVREVSGSPLTGVAWQVRRPSPPAKSCHHLPPSATATSTLAAHLPQTAAVAATTRITRPHWSKRQTAWHVSHVHPLVPTLISPIPATLHQHLLQTPTSLQPKPPAWLQWHRRRSRSRRSLTLQVSTPTMTEPWLSRRSRSVC